MDHKLVIAISGIPIPGTELPLDCAIMCHELLRNTLQSTGLSRNVQIIRSIGTRKVEHAVDFATTNRAQIHLLFHIHGAHEPFPYKPCPVVTTLQHGSASLFNYLIERLSFNNRPARFISYSPEQAGKTRLATALVKAFSQHCDMATVLLGSFFTTRELTAITKYSPTIARACAQALYQYIAASLYIPKRQGLPPSPAPYPILAPQPSTPSTEHGPEDTPQQLSFNFPLKPHLEVIR